MCLRKRLLVLLLLSCPVISRCQPVLNLDDQDNRIALVGNGFIEQESLSAYLETRIMRHALNRSIVCRNFGWSGDSVWGDARPAGFQNPAGVPRLMKDVEELKPTIIFVGYGFVESFDGEEGLAHFRQGYGALLDGLAKLTPTLVLFSPTIQEGDPQRNEVLEHYTKAIQEIAAKRKLPFVDLFHALTDFKLSHPAMSLTSNGITPNDCGYWIVASAVEKQLKLNAGSWRAELTAGGKIVSAEGLALVPSSNQPLRIAVTEQLLPLPACPCNDPASETDGQLSIKDLSPGQWTLQCDGQDVITADEGKWARGLSIPLKSDRDLAEQFRQAMIDSNALFYRRSRPFNDHPRHYTYIDKDYPLYDAQLAEQDKLIAGLRHPVVHEFQIIPKEAPKP